MCTGAFGEYIYTVVGVCSVGRMEMIEFCGSRCIECAQCRRNERSLFFVSLKKERSWSF